MVQEQGQQGRIRTISLSDLISKDNAEEDIQRLMELLSSFCCTQDKDIEDFLHNRAIDFELINKSRTYLLCDDNVLCEKGKLVILGYFSLALKVFNLREDVSNQTRKKLDGVSAKLHGEIINSVPCYLIGQLARNFAIPDERAISGAELIEQAFSFIHSAETLVGGRSVLIECHDNPKLIKFYNDNGFKEFARIPFNDTLMVQMIRTLCGRTL